MLSVRAKSVAVVSSGLVAAAPAQAAPPWSPPVAIAVADAPPPVEANEIDQSVLVPRVSAGKLGAAPQLVQWRGGADGRVLAALNGTRTLRVRTSSMNVASSRYAVSRILHLDARIVDRSQPGAQATRVPARARGPVVVRLRARRSAIRGRSAGRRSCAVNEDGSAIAAWHHIVRGRSDEIQVAWRFAGGQFSAIRTIATSRDRRRVDRRGRDRHGRTCGRSRTRATGSSRCA